MNTSTTGTPAHENPTRESLITTSSLSSLPALPSMAGESPTPGRVDFGYASRSLRLGPVHARVRTRALVVNLVLLALALAAAVFTMGIGDIPLSPGQVIQGLLGSTDEFTRMVVREWRFPPIVGALAFGGLLGVGGAIFQSLTRNPLGSPDVIGFDAGSYTAVVVVMLVVGTSDYYTVAAASIVGGLATAAVVYVLSWRRGVQGFRLIIVGIAVSAILGSLNAYLITRAKIEDAMAVGFWGAGSLARVTLDNLVPVLIASVVVFVVAGLLSRPLRQLELGDDAAMAQGIAASAARLGLIVVGVATTALVTAAAGPIGFIALVAPQLARRLTRSPGVSLTGAACMGAMLLTLAHLLSVVLAHAGHQVPVGLITIGVGGFYLIWLLIRETRRSA